MTSWLARPATAVFLKHSLPAADLPPGFRIGDRLDVTLPKFDPDTGRSLALLPCPFSTILFGAGEANGISGATSLSGEEHIVMPGDGTVLVVMLVRRRAGLSHHDFRERWLHGHAPFGLRTAASGYRQLHPSTEPNAGGFDGAGLVFFRDRDHAANARSAPEIARDATRDEMDFIDHGRSMLAMFQFR
jgi:hypothetical protein